MPTYRVGLLITVSRCPSRVLRARPPKAAVTSTRRLRSELWIVRKPPSLRTAQIRLKRAARCLICSKLLEKSSRPKGDQVGCGAPVDACTLHALQTADGSG